MSDEDQLALAIQDSIVIAQQHERKLLLSAEYELKFGVHFLHSNKVSVTKGACEGLSR